MAGKGSRHNPLVVKLVQILVNQAVVKPAMSPVDAEVGKQEKQRELEEVVPESRSIFSGIIELAVASDFEKEERCCDDGHDRHGLVGCDNLKADLVLDKTRVVKRSLVEDKDV